MSHSKQTKGKPRRSASVIIGVLVVILLVGMLSMQTIQTLALVRRGDDDRAKIMQARELSEFARGTDWRTAQSQSLTLQIPEAVNSLGDPEMQTAILERQTIADNPGAAKIVVRFPADKSGEITTTWEPNHE